MIRLKVDLLKNLKRNQSDNFYACLICKIVFMNCMVEVQSISKKENSSFQHLSWKDIQGLAWTLDESNFELNEKVSTCVCA